MAWLGFGKKETMDVITGDYYQSFSTPFGEIGKGNLTLPFIRSYSESDSYIRFGTDNLYPQLINQMYHQSPLNGSIINFKRNSVIGGGYTIDESTLSAKEKLDLYTFSKRFNLPKLVHQTTLDLILHGRILLLITKDKNDKITNIQRLSPETVRNNRKSTVYTTSDDWSRSTGMCKYPVFKINQCGDQVYEYTPSKGEAGQTIYPIPQYCSSLNSAYLDGEIPFMMKSNLINSIFPSLVITVAKKMVTDEEKNQFKKQIESLKGPQETGRVIAFAANTPDQLPTIIPIPTNENDKLFTETIENSKANICIAHNIDMLIMGIRVPGKLGSGAELPMSYAVFEKNVIMPLRGQMEEFVNDLLFINGIKSEFKINEYRIIENNII